ncbi:MAG TPA: hypothetical protein VLW85_14680 [Myxococcales bacterium]|nr:hypothetical protein [Myxococcales bacterium]
MTREVEYAPIGVPQFDADHRSIAARLNALARAADHHGEESAEEAAAILAEIEEHCTREELLMAELSYRDRERHLLAHEDMLAAAREDLRSGRCGWARRVLRTLARHQFTEDLLFGIAITAAEPKERERKTGT